MLALVCPVLARSRVYETAPWGDVPQGPYLNAAALVDFHHGPEALLDALLAIERAQGRVRDLRFGPRTIDLDLLWMDGVVVESERLTVPHPRLQERAFALLPLLEVASFAVDPRSGVRFSSPGSEGILRVFELDAPPRLLPVN